MVLVSATAPFGVASLTIQNGKGSCDGTIYSSADVTVTNSTFAFNHVGGCGRAIATIAPAAVTVFGSTFDHNSTAGGDSGAIGADMVSVTNSTFVGNQGGLGGAIVAIDGLTSVNNTLVGNVANGTIELDQGTVTLKNTILTGGGPNCFIGYIVPSVVSDSGGNFSDDASRGLTQASSHNSVAVAALKLGSLASNGGLTQTVTLRPGSAAIDPGISCPPPPADQRGVARPRGPACDSGAYEFVARRFVAADFNGAT